MWYDGYFRENVESASLEQVLDWGPEIDSVAQAPALWVLKDLCWIFNKFLRFYIHTNNFHLNYAPTCSGSVLFHINWNWKFSSIITFLKMFNQWLQSLWPCVSSLSSQPSAIFLVCYIFICSSPSSLLPSFFVPGIQKPSLWLSSV